MDEIIKRSHAMLEVLEESAHVINKCELYINFTDNNTPGRDAVLNSIHNYIKMMDEIFKEKK